jgi:hypothetical protein
MRSCLLLMNKLSSWLILFQIISATHEQRCVNLHSLIHIAVRRLRNNVPELVWNRGGLLLLLYHSMLKFFIICGSIWIWFKLLLVQALITWRILISVLILWEPMQRLSIRSMRPERQDFIHLFIVYHRVNINPIIIHWLLWQCHLVHIHFYLFRQKLRQLVSDAMFSGKLSCEILGVISLVNDDVFILSISNFDSDREHLLWKSCAEALAERGCLIGLLRPQIVHQVPIFHLSLSELALVLRSTTWG